MLSLSIRWRSVLAVASFLVGLSSLSSAARGVVVVDSFLTPQQAGPLRTTVPAPEVLGGTRGMMVGAWASAGVAGGSLVYSQTSTAQSYVDVYYDKNQLGLGPVDLTYGGSFSAFRVTVASSGLPGTLTIAVASDLYGNRVSRLSSSVATSDSPVIHLFPFQEFTQTGAIGPATFTSAQQVVLRFQSLPFSGPGQVTLSSILLVPEPATLCLLAFGGLAMTRRRRRFR